MDRLEMIQGLNETLLSEMPEYRSEAEKFGDNIPEQRRLLRSLMNVREPRSPAPGFISLQDELLSAEREEKGVGCNTPMIIKYPFWEMTAENPDAVYACVNKGEAVCPGEISGRSILIDGDIAEILGA